MTQLSVKESINFGWNKFWERPWFFVGVAIIMFAVNSIENSISKNSSSIWLLFVLINIPLYIGLTALSLKAQDDSQTLKIQDLWRPHPFWKYIGGVLLTILIIMAIWIVVGVFSGLLYLPFFSMFALPFIHGAGTDTQAVDTISTVFAFVLFPVLVTLLAMFATLIAARVFFVSYIIVDRNLPPITALKESIRITKGNFWRIVGLIMVLVLINILGVLCFFVGILVSYPVSILAFAHAYRFLEHQASEITTSA